MVHSIASKLVQASAYVCLCGAILATAALVRGDEFDPFQLDGWSSIPTMPVQDPFELPKSVNDPFEQFSAGGKMPPTTGAASPAPATYPVRSISYTYQAAETLPTLITPPQNASRVSSALSAGCGTPNERPLNQISIGTQMPQGDLPADHASACWQQLNTSSGPLAAARLWARQSYAWDATCMAHRPLYFEEINLERYGYGCHDCLQPVVSAAHFFATVPALPYCMAADCPGECQYTLGHYRPGSCPPWRCHRPPVSTLGGMSEAGVLTGLIFLIP